MRFGIDPVSPSPTIPRTMFATRLLHALPLSLLFASGCATCCRDTKAEENAKGGVSVTRRENRVRVEIGGQLFTEYYFQDVPRPYCYPVIGPGGLAMTRNYPMKQVEGEEQDHLHHRSLWYGHLNVNGHDFWGEAAKSGKVVHEQFLELKGGKTSGVIKAQNKWVAADGTVVCTDERKLTFYNQETTRTLDFEITLKASHGEVVIGDDKDGTMAIRLAESMRLKPTKPNADKPTGHIVQSTGVRDGDTWGKRAAWCDYYGLVDGKIVGVAIFDHPKNPRHPTWWHVRDYGLFAANPFGQHHFEKLSDKDAGALKIPAGQSVTFRYRFYFHAGDEQQGKVAEHYRDYIK